MSIICATAQSEGEITVAATLSAGRVLGVDIDWGRFCELLDVMAT